MEHDVRAPIGSTLGQRLVSQWSAALKVARRGADPAQKNPVYLAAGFTLLTVSTPFSNLPWMLTCCPA
jgi:hypothetical protein